MVKMGQKYQAPYIKVQVPFFIVDRDMCSSKIKKNSLLCFHGNNFKHFMRLAETYVAKQYKRELVVALPWQHF